MRFEKQERVTVPGIAAQGVIMDATENIMGFPVYTLRWLDEAGETHTGSCGEGDLAAANLTDEQVMQAAAAEVEAEKQIERRVRDLVSRKLRIARRKPSKRKR